MVSRRESLLGVVTGEVGVGETVALRDATRPASSTCSHHLIDVTPPTFGARGLYPTIVHALGVRLRAQKAEQILRQEGRAELTRD